VEEEAARVRVELMALQETARADTADARSSLEQQLVSQKEEHAASAAAMQTEVAAARAEVDRLKTDLGASGGDARLAVSRAETAERDVARLTAELEGARGMSAQKDADLRSTLQVYDTTLNTTPFVALHVVTLPLGL
jgi:hypothetical protein